MNITIGGDDMKLNSTLKLILQHCSSRARNPKDGVLDLRRTKAALRDEGVSVVPKDFMRSFEALTKAGLGELILEEGKNPRFIWKGTMKTEAQKLLKKAEAVEPLTENLRTPKGKESESHSVFELATALMAAELSNQEVQFLITLLQKKRPS